MDAANTYENRCTNLSLCKQCNYIEPCVGDQGCSIEKIVKILSKSVTFGQFTENWTDLAIALEINSVRISKWKKSLILDTLDIKMVLSKILEEWVAISKTSQDKAKLSVLIENLESEGFKQMANELRQKLSDKYPSLDHSKRDGVSGSFNDSVPLIPTSAGHLSISITNNCQVERESLIAQANPRESTEQPQSTKVKVDKKNKSRSRYWAVGSILLAIITGLVLYFSIFHNTESKPQNISTTPCLHLARSYDDFETSDNMHQIDTSSYNEYQKLAEPIIDNKPISLAITLNRKGQWPHDAVLSKACSIKELNITGLVDFSFMSWILNQTTQVESFHLEILNWSDCEEYDTRTAFSNPNQDCVTTLPNLLTLTLSHSCANTWIYKCLSSLQMTNLETFKVSNGIINEVNVKYLRSLLDQSKKLKIFHLIAHLSTNKLVYPFGYKATSIREVRIENITRTSQKSDYSRLILGEDFCDTFPELKVFQSTNSCISFIDRYLVFSCPNLRKLTISICYSGNEYHRLGIVQKLSHLEELDLYLVFPDGNCPPSDELGDVRQEVYNSTVKSKRVCSNCILHSTRKSYCVVL